MLVIGVLPVGFLIFLVTFHGNSAGKVNLHSYRKFGFCLTYWLRSLYSTAFCKFSSIFDLTFWYSLKFRSWPKCLFSQNFILWSKFRISVNFWLWSLFFDRPVNLNNSHPSWMSDMSKWCCIRQGKVWSLSGILPFHQPVPGSTGKNRLKYKNAVFSQPSGYFFMKISRLG